MCSKAVQYGHGSVLTPSRRHFLALVEFESKKKKRAAKAASEYMEKLEDNINRSEDSLKRHLVGLNVEMYLDIHPNPHDHANPRQKQAGDELHGNL